MSGFLWEHPPTYERFIAYSHGFMGSPFDGGESTTTVYVRTRLTDANRRVAGHEINGGTAAWSPDSREIALAGYNGIYVVARSGADAHRIVKLGFSTPAAPSWSSRGEIAFINDGEVDSAPAGGGQVARLASCDCSTQTDGVAWSPDGNKLAYSTSHGIYVIASNGQDRRTIVRY